MCLGSKTVTRRFYCTCSSGTTASTEAGDPPHIMKQRSGPETDDGGHDEQRTKVLTMPALSKASCCSALYTSGARRVEDGLGVDSFTGSHAGQRLRRRPSKSLCLLTSRNPKGLDLQPRQHTPSVRLHKSASAGQLDELSYRSTEWTFGPGDVVKGFDPKNSRNTNNKLGASSYEN